MSRFTCIVSSVAVLVSMVGVARPASAANTLTDAEKKAGWKLLFDGKTANGWRNYKKEGISKGWVVQEGALTRSDKGAGDIITVDQYDSFELSLEYNISKAGNSGIMFHVTEEGGAPWHTGPEIQVQDNIDGHDPQKAGWLYQLYAPAKDPATGQIPDATRPPGQWNHIQIRITPVQCEVNMNGVRYSQFQKGSKDWDDRVAKSKFASMPQFGKPTKGYICLQDHGDRVAYRNIKVRSLPADGTAPDPSDGELKVKIEQAFPNLTWQGWSGENEGLQEPFRPIIITHAGDGSHRLFVANQWGDVYVFPDDPEAKSSKRFINLRDRVSYKDKENEEGLLGMAFHPKFKQNGEFFVYYTSKQEPHTSIVSRFRVSPDNPDAGNPASEQQILKIPQPFWNHNGGTIVFGPDGYLYVGLGDGGAGNDPHGHGQNLGTWLGSILRIDVDHHDAGKPYAIPKDNPFVGKEGAQPEIFAYGFRNIWRMSFDRADGTFWCADVGQNLWEEIDIVTKGGNYGWNLREGLHTFSSQVSEGRTDLIDPIWEYDHQVGKSITGGHVYRGRKVPELTGKYVYADYVSGRIWALKYDTSAKKVISNERIPSPSYPVITFGEDEAGEIYFGVVSPDGKGIYRFAK